MVNPQLIFKLNSHIRSIYGEVALLLPTRAGKQGGIGIDSTEGQGFL